MFTTTSIFETTR